MLATLLIRVRLEPIANAKRFVLPNPMIFRRPSFVMVTIAAYFLEWGLFVPVTYLTSYCLGSGAFNTTFSYQVVAIYNGSSTIGRWLSGYLADHFGAYNIMIIMVFFRMSTSAGLWLPAAIFSEEPLADGAANHKPTISGLTISYAVIMDIATGSNISSVFLGCVTRDSTASTMACAIQLLLLAHSLVCRLLEPS